MSTLAFPNEFVFGVATSAYQVDGDIENDWSEWERAGKLKDPHCRNGAGVQHWARFADDLQLITACGASAYRLSLEWARLEPRPGEFDEEAWQGTRDRLELLVRAGIKPVVTLHHFTHPAWFHVQCPWHEASSLNAWGRYVKRCAELLDGIDASVVTINEPNVLLLGGYIGGLIPPGIANPTKAFAAFANLARAHVIAVQALRARPGKQAIEVGIAQNMLSFRAARRLNPFDHALSRLAGQAYNHAFLEALHTGRLSLSVPGILTGQTTIDGAVGSMTFLGVNYYTRTHLKFLSRAPWVSFDFVDVHKRGLTDIGWELYPEGFGQVLRSVKRYGLKVWVTENGLDDRSGQRRTRFIHDHLHELLLARADGVPVEAYFHWSLMDNFEWLEGWGPRFGLFEVNRATLERKATPAVPYLRRIAETRTLSAPE